MQLSQKGYNNAKPTRFKTTTQLLNIKCCPLQIKRKGWGGVQKMLESKTERAHLHNVILLMAEYTYILKTTVAFKLDKL